MTFITYGLAGIAMSWMTFDVCSGIKEVVLEIGRQNREFIDALALSNERMIQSYERTIQSYERTIQYHERASQERAEKFQERMNQAIVSVVDNRYF